MHSQRSRTETTSSKLNTSLPRRISTLTIVLFALAGFFFWVAGEIRWSQTFRKNNLPAQEENTELTGAITIKEKAEANGHFFEPDRATSRKITVIPEASFELQKPTRASTKFNPSVYQQLIKTCNYWTEKVRAGESVTSLQSVSCNRARNYAGSTGNSTAPTVNIKTTVTHPDDQNFVRLDSNATQVKNCDKIDSRIKWVNSRLRAGYRIAQGERWKQELRDLKKERHENC